MILLDTSLLVRMTRSRDPQSGVARAAIQALLRRRERPVVVPQNLYEFWAVATRARGAPPAGRNGLGMTPAQVVAMVNTTTGFLGLLATGAGIPLGLFFTRGILASLSQAYGIGEVNVTLNYLYLFLLIPMMVAVSMVGSLIPARQAANISIVRVLRNE